MNWMKLGENIIYTSIVLTFFIIIGISLMQIKYKSNMKAKKKFYAKLQNDIKVGKNVTFGNGIYGKIIYLDEEIADIQVKSGAVLTISRFVISSIEN